MQNVYDNKRDESAVEREKSDQEGALIDGRANPASGIARKDLSINWPGSAGTLVTKYLDTA